jgi:hypothetical protein
MYPKYPVYFLQTKPWLEFWKNANLPGHDYLHIAVEVDILLENPAHTLKILLQSFIYIYPWQLGQKFFYIPKSPVVELLLDGKSLKFDAISKVFNESDLQLIKQNFLQLFDKLLLQFATLAQQKDVAFIKLDLDDNFTEFLDIKDNAEILSNIKKVYPRSVISGKTIQYLQAMVLELENVKPSITKTKDYTNQTLISFFDGTKSFWAKTNENVRRYTKKSLSQGWQVSTLKTPENFEAFWQVYSGTSERQHFSTHHKNVVETLMKYDFSRIIIVRDEQGDPQCVWMGVVSDNTLTYLYGGNTEDSFKKYGQYLVHLSAVKMVYDEGLRFYDLGRYDPTKSYSKFKENYRGQIRNFLGPVDLIIKPSYYYYINFLIAVVKIFRK